MSDRPNSFVVSHAGRQSPKDNLHLGALLPDSDVGKLIEEATHRAVALAERLLLDSPTLSCLPRQTPTQEANWATVGNAAAFGPISAMICWAKSMPKPGSSASLTIASSWAFIASAIIFSSAETCDSIRSRRSR